MPDFTPNLNLVKPTISENITVDLLNDNSDAIDAYMASINTDIDALSASIAALNVPWSVVSDVIPVGMSAITPVPGVTHYSNLRYRALGKTAFCTFNFGVLSASTDGVGFKYVLPWDLSSVASASGTTGQACGNFSLYAKATNGTSYIYTGTVIMTATAGQNSVIEFYVTKTNSTSTGPYSQKFGTTSPAVWNYSGPFQIFASFILELP